ncbi:MAG TPA: type IV pilus modification protein PilV [Cellvibrio sp.]|nr:type IV pilus modification protein PilV [Cellvibrio sp.]
MNITQRQSGTTLIEVIVTVLILATSLLAMAALQTRSLQYNQGAFMRSQANIYAYDIIDRIRINRGAAGSNVTSYNVDYEGSPSGGGLVASDIKEWRDNIKLSLPEGKGKIECQNAAAGATARVCKVTIKWSDEQLFGAVASTNPEATSELVYSTSI